MRILVSAGEASGDLLGAEVLRTLGSEVALKGLVGPHLRALHPQTLARTEDLSVMGVGEVIAALPRILGLRRTMLRALESGVDLFLGIDSPDFNLPLARRAKALGIPVVLLGTPQVWAWRKGRAKGIAALADLLLCLFPFEPPYFQAHGGDARFLGHPGAVRQPLLGPPGKDWALLPGSRASEIKRLLPTLVQAGERLRTQAPGSQLRLPVAPGLDRRLLQPAVEAGVLLVDSLAEALEPAQGALVASGTATLEVACAGRPQVICYRTKPSTYHLGRALVRDIQHIGLPNLLLPEHPIPERIQRFSAEDLVGDLLATQRAGAQRDIGPRIREVLQGEGAAERLGQAILELA
ncbi:MAG: lipid-A-disaccharide synthase [Myxococcota bacterium]|nr:lipid-A-disaccharide synthase [Myxococcota bacterium]